MKVAITSSGNSLDSALDLRFGRAQYFIVVDMDTGLHEVVSNDQNVHAAQGAGIQAGKNVIDTGAVAVITGNVGPKAYRTLQAAQIKIYVYPDDTATVQKALERFKKGELQEAIEANVSGHWM